MLGVTLSPCVCVCRIGLGGEGNALYPVLSSFFFTFLWVESGWVHELVGRVGSGQTKVTHVQHWTVVVWTGLSPAVLRQLPHYRSKTLTYQRVYPSWLRRSSTTTDSHRRALGDCRRTDAPLTAHS